MKEKSPYNNPQWKKFSKAFLLANPLCVMCLGNKKFTASQHTDHIRGYTNRAEFFDPSNCQALCISCHSMKTHTAGGDDWKRRKQKELGIKYW